MERESLSRKKAILVLGMMMIGANSKKIANYQEPNCNVYAADGSCDKCSFRFWMTPEDGRCHQVSDQCKTWCEQTGACTSCYGGYGLTSTGQCTIGGVETTPVHPTPPPVTGGDDCDTKSCGSNESDSSRRRRRWGSGKKKWGNWGNGGNVGQPPVSNPDHCVKYEYVNSQTNQRQLSWFLGCQKVCTECEWKFYLDKDNKCQPNPANCWKADRNGDCLKCRRGWEPNDCGECVLVENPIEHCEEYKYVDSNKNSFLKWFSGCNRVCAKCQRGYQWCEETKTCERVNNIWRHPRPDSPRKPVGSPVKTPSCESNKPPSCKSPPSVKAPSCKSPSVKAPSCKSPPSVKAPSCKSGGSPGKQSCKSNKTHKTHKSCKSKSPSKKSCKSNKTHKTHKSCKSKPPSCKTNKSPSCKSVAGSKKAQSPGAKSNRSGRVGSPAKVGGKTKSAGKHAGTVRGSSPVRTGSPSKVNIPVRSSSPTTKGPGSWPSHTGTGVGSPTKGSGQVGAHTSSPSKWPGQVGAQTSSPSKVSGQTGSGSSSPIKRGPFGNEAPNTVRSSSPVNNQTKGQGWKSNETGVGSHFPTKTSQSGPTVRSEGGKGADKRADLPSSSTGVRETGSGKDSGRIFAQERGQGQGHKFEGQRVTNVRQADTETKPAKHETVEQTKPARNPDVENQVRSQPEPKKEERAQTRDAPNIRAENPGKSQTKIDVPTEPTRITRNPNADNQLRAHTETVADTPAETKLVKGQSGKKVEEADVVFPLFPFNDDTETKPVKGQNGKKADTEAVVRPTFVAEDTQSRVVKGQNGKKADTQAVVQPVAINNDSETRIVRGQNGKKAETEAVVQPAIVQEVNQGKVKGKSETDALVRSDPTDTKVKGPKKL